MNEIKKYEKIKNYIYNKRMISVKNIYEYFNLNFIEVRNIINQLIEEKKIRIAASSFNSCSSRSNNCQSCENHGQSHTGTESLIIISLNKKILLE